MKHQLRSKLLFLLSFLSLILIAEVSCRKETIGSTTSPIAVANVDMVILMDACPINSLTYDVQLDASRSYDPSRGPVEVLWESIRGVGLKISNPHSKNTLCQVPIEEGTYGILLTVKNESGKTSRDTVWVNVRYAHGGIRDIDMDFKGTFHYIKDDWDVDYYDNPILVDRLSADCVPVNGSTDAIHLLLTETILRKSPLSSYVQMSLLDSTGNTGGYFESSIFSALTDGRRTISGKLTIDNSIWATCRSEQFKLLKPLNITGNLSPADSTLTIHVQGKVMF